MRSRGFTAAEDSSGRRAWESMRSGPDRDTPRVSERADLIRRWYAALPADTKGDLDDAYEALAAVLGDSVGPGFDGAMIGPGFENRFTGVDGFREAWGDWVSAWQEFHVGLEELEEGASGVCAHVSLVGRLAGAGAEVTQGVSAAWIFEGDLIRRVEMHTDRALARAAVGLPPPS